MASIILEGMLVMLFGGCEAFLVKPALFMMADEKNVSSRFHVWRYFGRVVVCAVGDVALISRLE